MALDSGTKLGPYEILAPIGAGGMGEVYRARDPRLGRDVAVKVLPAAFARDKERLQRFEHEARAAGALNHPGITAIYDLGTSGGIPYLVSELLEGESLRTALAPGALPPRRVADLGIQAAQALAAAHAKGIVHRDLKPENLHLLRDGRLKVLDFGLAKLTAMDAPPRDETGPQLASLTLTGTILGTASYMAPEQVRELSVDHRADIFALGAILYELASGVKAFPGETPADRMTAILVQDPKPLPPDVESELPGLEAVIRRCLEKRADDRFDSARDLAYTLRILVAAADGVQAGAARSRDTQRTGGAAHDVRFRQLTFREGSVSGARFSSDGQTVVYGATWGSEPHQLFIARIGSQEPRPLEIPEAVLLDVSTTDELLVRLRTRDLGGFIELGVLARVPLMGGVPRELMDSVTEAAFGPDGKRIAVVRDAGGTMRLEYPAGTVIHESEGWISDPQVLSDGRVAFIDHPSRGDTAGRPAITGPGGLRHLVAERFLSARGFALVPGSNEALLSAQERDGTTGLFLVSLDGGYRPAIRMPTVPMVEDISVNRDVLLNSLTPRMRMEFGTREQPAHRDLSWLDWTLARGLTPDGRMVLFDESGPAIERAMAFLRGTDGSPAIQIADGNALDLSPDGLLAVIVDQDDPTRFDLVPTGMGESVRHSVAPVHVAMISWFPDGKSMCLSGHEPGKKTRLYRYDLGARTIAPISDEGTGRAGCAISPDGRFVLTQGPQGHILHPLEGGEPRVLSALGPQHRGMRFTPDATAVLAFERGRLPCRLFRVDLESGRAEVCMEIPVRRDGGVRGINALYLSSDGDAYVTSYQQILSELHVARGLIQP